MSQSEIKITAIHKRPPIKIRKRHAGGPFSRIFKSVLRSIGLL